MAELSPEERIKLAVQFIAQSPPGEVNAVEHEADEAANIYPHVSLLSEAVIAPTTGTQERFVDFEAARSFSFDHVRMTPSDYEPYVLPSKDEAIRKSFAESLSAYTRNHFTEGRWSVACDQYPVATAAVGVLEPAPTPTGSQSGSVSASVPPSRAVSPAVPPIPEGIAVPSDTPADGTSSAASDLPKDAEVDAPGGLKDLDDEMEGVAERLDPTGTAALGETPGKLEPEPTPSVGDADLPKDAEVDQPGALADLDREIAEEVEAEAEAMAEDNAASGAAAGAPAATGAAAVDDEKFTSLDAKLAEVEAADAAGGHEIPSASATPAALKQTPIAQESRAHPSYTLEVVGNRYNPSNFWTGRWRTRWVVDPAVGTVTGTILVDVHYYEQGNVQLSTEHRAAFPVPVETWEDGRDAASQIVGTIAKIEQAYQLELGDVYEEFGEKSFRNLRRALPVTRQKIDWDKVQGYSLGSDLSKAR
ncbi:F-actin capping [Trichosporon asahii var. asahii CBS 2479]|uniref:F-actin capping n=1 Tax=Trichosporon asahii var. asahii (strain ATCC 90039 / CBS 2479 / JCM 2466 / KCTC 7840 / NBRC 103889/ NCYC 2677 / UAMH 7654) TaxID=1186058 RepID=J5TFK9_TRIAS|nr:F-actin capping [Trichosporon asahii var. asahii CBS 2479]EJT50686.1 F-actin capping [Trichosporon asahii var. asahii CBS 2479]